MLCRLKEKHFTEMLAHIDTCNELFPMAFPKRASGTTVFPLKIGVKTDLHEALAAAGKPMSMLAIRRMLTFWCSRNFYLKSLKEAAHRIDLHGIPAGELTEEQRLMARKALTERTSRLEAKAETFIEAIEDVAQAAL
jgi:ProP effector